MKLYLDDIRPAPKGWALCRWPEEVIELIEQGEVEEISLDHDLGDSCVGGYGVSERTGMDVLTWLKNKILENKNFVIPRVNIHTGNIIAEKRMYSLLKDIQKIKER